MESLMFYSNCALFIRWASFVLVRLIRRTWKFILLSFHSLFCFPPGVERVFVLIIFIAAPSSTIVIEESALGVSQPFCLLCLEILHLFIINKHSCIETTLHLCPVVRERFCLFSQSNFSTSDVKILCHAACRLIVSSYHVNQTNIKYKGIMYLEW